MPGAIRRARICRFSICQVRRLAATLGRDHVLPQSHIDQVIGAIGAEIDGPAARAAACSCDGGGGVIHIAQRQRSVF